jgi:hypothetical protein
MFLRNVDIYLQVHMTLPPRRPTHSSVDLQFVLRVVSGPVAPVCNPWSELYFMTCHLIFSTAQIFLPQNHLCTNYVSACLLIADRYWHYTEIKVFTAIWIIYSGLMGYCGMQSSGCTLFRRNMVTASSGLNWERLISERFIQGLEEDQEEVCTGLGLGLVVQIMFGFGPGSGLVVQIIFGVRAGLRPGSNDSNQMLHGTFRAFSGYFFRKEKVIRSCAHLMLVTQSGSGNKSHRLDCLGNFRSCPLPQIVRDNTLQTWYPISLYRSPNAEITLDGFRESLNNSNKGHWHYALKETCINDTIVRAVCK